MALLAELAAGLVLPSLSGKYFWLCAGTAGVDHGCDWSDANLAGSLIGQKLAINDSSLT